MIVYKLTLEEAEMLVGQEYTKDLKFSPTEDADGNWFISIEEIEQCDNEKFMWVKDLPQIEHKPKVSELP